MQGRKAIIWEEGGADPTVDRIEVGDGEDGTTLVAVPEPPDVVGLAKDLLDEGVERIELCGAFGHSTPMQVRDHAVRGLGSHVTLLREHTDRGPCRNGSAGA